MSVLPIGFMVVEFYLCKGMDLAWVKITDRIAFSDQEIEYGFAVESSGF